MGLKHSKYRNTGIIFELLTRQITTDILNESESKAILLLKKYFSKTELGKEYKLYEYVSKKGIDDNKAKLILESVLEYANKLDKDKLKSEKYQLIREIKKHYDLTEFFKTKIPNYKVYASLYNLMEHTNVKPEELVNNKVSILESLTQKELIKEETELNNLDKDERILTYKLLLEKFNNKYKTLNNNQKIILKEYIYNIDNDDRLKNFYNKSVREIKSKLSLITENLKDKTTQIKLTEVNNLLLPLEKTQRVDDNDLINLLYYTELIDELK